MSLATATSRQLVEEYLDWMQHSKRRSPSTVYTYGRIYSSLLAHLDGKHMLATTHEDLERFVFARPRTKARGPRPAAATVKVEAMAIRSLFKWLSARGLVHRDPTLRLLESLPAVHNEDPRPIPDHLWKALWFSDLDDSDRVAFGLGYLCGLRRREVVRLAAGNFLSDGRLVGVQRKGGRVEGFPLQSAVRLHEARLSHLTGDVTEQFVRPLERLLKARADAVALLAWRDERSERHVTRQIHEQRLGTINPDTFNRRLRSALVRLGLPSGAVSPHMLRHSFCTNLIAVGVPIHVVSRLAGHSSVNVTMRYVSLGEDPLSGFLGTDDHSPPQLPSRHGANTYDAIPQEARLRSESAEGDE